jgi:Uma2 family endonuclease
MCVGHLLVNRLVTKVLRRRVWRARGVTMTAMKLKSPATIDDLLKCPKDGRKYELVDGEILVSPAGFQHAQIVARIVHIIATFLEAHPMGQVCADNLGINFPNGNLRSPDVTFVRNEKVPVGKAAEAFAEFIPDLAVEVLSPPDSLKEVGEKIGEFLECGVPVVWLVDPERQTVTIYRSLSQTEQLSSKDIITAEPILPGFSCSVSRFF